MPPDTSNVQHQRDDNVSPDQQMNQLLEETPFLDVEVSSTALFDGAYQVVTSIFPSWQREHVKFVQCKDGITNQCKSIAKQEFGDITDFHGIHT